MDPLVPDFPTLAGDFAAQRVITQFATAAAAAIRATAETASSGRVRFIESRCPDGCSFECDLLSLEDLRG